MNLQSYADKENNCDFFCMRLQEHTEIFENMFSDQAMASLIMKAGDNIVEALKNHGGIFLCGNGGSAADAQHIAAEFVSRFYKERPGMNAEALTVNTSVLTAIGNDYSFDRIFARQLEAKAHSGDIVIGLSTSGTSKNVLEALKYAGGHNMTTILMTGSACVDGLDGIDYIMRVPSIITPRIQEAHIFIGHVIAEYAEHRMYGCVTAELY